MLGIIGQINKLKLLECLKLKMKSLTKNEEINLK